MYTHSPAPRFLSFSVLDASQSNQIEAAVLQFKWSRAQVTCKWIPCMPSFLGCKWHIAFCSYSPPWGRFIYRNETFAILIRGRNRILSWAQAPHDEANSTFLYKQQDKSRWLLTRQYKACVCDPKVKIIRIFARFFIDSRWWKIYRSMFIFCGRKSMRNTQIFQIHKW
jgi:hypothetical protein